jgi:small-conductance mechanosensitive channel
MRSPNKRRAYNTRNLLRLVFGFVGTVATLAVLTENRLGLLFSLGVIGFAVTFALQQPLLSLIAWAYITVKQPYGVGDRVRIDDAKGDVIGVDFLVTTLWEINGELVTTNQPSGRVVTVPNSVVLSSNVVNFGGGGSPYVWNEVGIQVAYETDLDFAREVMAEEARDLLGDEMADGIAAYREALAETPVEMEVSDGPTVNVTQGESWVELRVRYLTHPRRGQRVKNRLYERILERFNDVPDRVAFPVSRSRQRGGASADGGPSRGDILHDLYILTVQVASLRPPARVRANPHPPVYAAYGGKYRVNCSLDSRYIYIL